APLARTFGKKIGLLKESVAGLTSIAVLNIPANAAISREAADAVSAAKLLGLRPMEIDFDQSIPLQDQFDRVLAANIQAVYVTLGNYFFATSNDALCSLLLKNRLPSATSANQNCGLIGYGPNPTSQYYKFGNYIDAILKGAKPGDLPVE